MFLMKMQTSFLCGDLYERMIIETSDETSLFYLSDLYRRIGMPKQRADDDFDDDVNITFVW